MPAAASAAASSAVKTTAPTAAPGEAPRPLVRIGVLGGDPLDGLGVGQVDHLVVDHVDGHPERRTPRPLAHTGLEHPELSLVDGELRVAHVPVVRLKSCEHAHQLVVDGGETILKCRQGLCVADPRDHILALGVHEEVAVRSMSAGGRVTCEADTRAGVVVAVAEDHRLNVHGGSEIVRYALAHPVRDGAGTVPRLENGLDGASQLVLGLLREGTPCRLRDDLFQLLDQLAQLAGGDIGVGLGAGGHLQALERLVEHLARYPEHDPSVHLDEAPVRVKGKTLIVRLLSQPLH